MTRVEHKRLNVTRTFTFTQDEIKEMLIDKITARETLYDGEKVVLYLDDTECKATLEITRVTENTIK
jgi:hypothetical protein